MNIPGTLLYLAIILAFLYTVAQDRKQHAAPKPDLVALECQRLALEEAIAAKRTTLAVFTTLEQEIESQRHVIEIYKCEIADLNTDYERLVQRNLELDQRNAALDEIYGTFSEAWKASEQA